MSRYYKIVVSNETAAPPGGGTASNLGGATWTNQINGKCDIGAQQIEFDLPVTTYDAPMGQAYVRIWGPTKQQISQASDFNGAAISVFGGMQKGLPLASAQAAQAGLLVKGVIFQAFGNWQGLVQTLDFVIAADGGATQSEPANLVVNWPKGTDMAQIVQNTLQGAYPNYTINMNVTKKLTLSQDEHHVAQTLQQFSSYVTGLSQDIGGGTYQGIKIALSGQTFTVFDTGNGDTIQIAQQDLIGQVTWINANTIQFNTVLRGDIQMGSVVQLPQLAGAQAVTTAASQSNARAKNTFQGTWTVNLIRHIGNSRSPDAQSWVSTYQAYSNTANPAVSGSSA